MRNPRTQACLEKPTVCCRQETLTHIHQGVAIGRKRSLNNLLIAESTASLTTKLTRTSSTCTKVTEQLWKLVVVEKSLKNDSHEDSIPSEKAAKDSYEAGNCNSHEIQQRTNNVQCQRCYLYMEAGFQVCPCGGKLNMSEEMLSSIRQKLSNSLQMPTCHSKEREEPSMVLSHGKSTTS